MARLLCFAFLLIFVWEIHGVDLADVKNTISRFFTESSEDVEPFVFVCPKDGLFPNTRNCSTFVQCSNGDAHLMPCPANLHFSVKTQRCEAQCEAQCDRTLACGCQWPTCTKALCFLPREMGPCRGHRKRYYYDKDRGLCRRFVYFGCEGNENNFKTISECEKVCEDAVDVCKLPSMKGPCEKHIRRYFFNSKKGKCQKFTFGGCQGNGNNFETKEQCEQKCKSKAADAVSKEATDTSKERIETSEERIEISEERIETSEERSDMLVGRISIECLSDPDPGHCTNKTLRWNYNSRKDKCSKFWYGGCEGNGNNYFSKEECEIVCLNERKLVSGDEIPDIHFCHNNGRQPYFRSCTKYVFCLNQIGYIMRCPPGLHFHAKTGKCVVPCAAFCDPDFACICKWKKCVNNGSAVPKCPEPNGNFAVPTNCSIYIQCTDSVLTLQECPKGTAYDIVKRTCVPSNKAVCYLSEDEELESQDLKCPEDNGNFSVPTNCSIYIQCTDSVPTIQECPKATSFDIVKRMCVPSNKAVCYLSDDEGLNSQVFKCPQKNGNFSVSTYCTKYFECKASKPTTKECPEGKSFDREKKICVPWYEAICYHSIDVELNTRATFKCPEKNGNFSVPMDCTKYIDCTKYKPTPKECPKGKSFDSKKKICVPWYEAICYHSTETDLKFPLKFKCPQRNGNFSVPLDCTKYFDCKDSESTPKECPRGKNFDSKKKICVPWYEAFCYQEKLVEADRVTDHIPCSPEGNFPYRPNCKKFIRCLDTWLTLEDCPKDKSYDYIKKVCVPDKEARCYH